MSVAYDDPQEEPGEFDDVEDDGGDVLPCPECGCDVYDDTDQCPHCGQWIMPLAASAGRKHWVWRVAALLALGSFLALYVL